MYTPEMDALIGDELDDLALQQVVGGIDLRYPTPQKFNSTLDTIPEKPTGAPKGVGAGYIVGGVIYGVTHQ